MRKLGVELFLDAAAYERSLRKAAAGTSKFGKELSRAGRGALAGSGAFKGLGRSVAFASGGFLAFESGTAFLRETIDAARDAGVSQRALAAQMKASGESFSANRDRIEQVSRSYSRFGFQNDEVVKSLTVLERATGSVNKAVGLQGLVADLARAKNLDLAAAAATVGKVFGGQETALRRAVPGLAKNAHGIDLIREAQRKLAGQAAANTTVAERFAATLHDTEEIIGNALLPTLNQLLGSMSKYLEQLNDSGKLEKDVASGAAYMREAFTGTKEAVDPLVISFNGMRDAVGGTKNQVKLLVAAFVAFKALKFARANPYIALFTGIAAAASFAAGKVEALQKLALGAKDATFKQGAGVETTLVPALAKQIKTLQGQGVGGKQILEQLRARLGTSLKADDLIGEAFVFASGDDPKLTARIRAQVADRGKIVKKAVADETKKDAAPGASVSQRNSWFDAMINRQLGRVQDIASLKGQNTRLGQIAAEIERRLKVTKDITRKLTLEDQLLEVVRQQKDNRAQISQNQADAIQAAKDEALAWADFAEERAAATKPLQDDLKAAQVKLAILKKQAAVGKKTAEQAQAIWEQTQKVRDLAKQIKDAGKSDTGFRSLSTSQVLAAIGPGAGRAQQQRILDLFATLGPRGTAPRATAQFAGAGGVTITGGVHLHGVTNTKQMEQALTKRAKARAHVRRGAR